ncbi:MAG: hypothetical protein ACRDY7_13675 [Acidimicrobiia bacterium]
MSVLSALVLGLGASVLPVDAGEAVAQEEVFPGFTAVDAYAQGQAATGFFFAVGDEENRLMGAQSVINGPPAGSGNVAAFVQRGIAATYAYGVAGGGGNGQAGVLPEPPPGQASAFFPSGPPESTFEGPVTGAADGQVVDSRFYAKATDTPTGLAEAAITALEMPDQFKVDNVVVVSRTGPAEGGVVAESITILRGLTIGPLRIETLVSTATGFVSSAPGEPEGRASTVIQGATVNGSAVQITDKGVVAGESTSPGAQDQINTALADAGLSEVRLTASGIVPGDNNQSVQSTAGGLRVVYRDEEFGSQNPQGFSGGGFSVGGADVRVLGLRDAG